MYPTTMSAMELCPAFSNYTHIAKLIGSIGQWCQRLDTLDLSYIPLSGKVSYKLNQRVFWYIILKMCTGKLLIKLSAAIGHSLRNLRLIYCFEWNDDISSEWNTINAEEFSQFLTNMPNLENFDISHNLT